MHKAIRNILIFSLGFLGSAAVASDGGDAPGASPVLDKLLSLKVVRSAEVSPDGAYVAYQIFENDFKADKDMTQLWVVDTEGGLPVQLTTGDEPVGEYEWLANSKAIAFMREGKMHIIRASGGEATEVDLKVKGARALRFAPDGSTLYFLAGEGEKTVDQKKAKAREERYGKYNVVKEDGNYRHLWRADINEDFSVEGKPKQLTDGRDFSVTGYALSPDSQTIAFATWPSPHLSDLLNGRVYTIDVEGENQRLLDDNYGSKSTPVWHTEGHSIAYTNGTGFPEYSDIVFRQLESDEGVILDMPNHNASLQFLGGEDGRLQFTAGERTALGLYSISVEAGDIDLLSDRDTFAFGVSYARDGKTIAYLSATSDSLAEVTVATADGIRKLTDHSSQLEGMALPSKELIRWQSDNGLEIEAVLTKPANFEPGKRYPLYVRTHGGPTGTDRPWMVGAARSFYHPEVLAAEGEGALVLQTNYRGSASYGEAFQTSNIKNLGIGPARDIIAGVNKLVAEGLVDPDRVACLGWSQGGHISAMLATYSDVCTAAIMGAGISDWRTYYYNTDITQFTTEYFKATPYSDDAVYAKTSPVTYIENAKTPVLIQHGENDPRVPIANGYQFRQLLLDKGVEARMIVYADMLHGPSKPRTRRAISEHALSWMREKLFAGSETEFVRPLAVPNNADDEGC